MLKSKILDVWQELGLASNNRDASSKVLHMGGYLALGYQLKEVHGFSEPHGCSVQ